MGDANGWLAGAVLCFNRLHHTVRWKNTHRLPRSAVAVTCQHVLRMSTTQYEL